MFGFVTASIDELTEQQRKRYEGVYCGICRAIGDHDGQFCRLSLQYDMAFLALLLMSLYEPEESGGGNACILHPIKKRSWIDNAYVRYAAQMNVALAYYNFKDDVEDEGKLSSRVLTGVFGRHQAQIAREYPRQARAIEECIARLNQLEKENCANPDECANCMGTMMGELLVYREDLWSGQLRKMGMGLGRFTYLADAAMDYRRDKKKGKFNPFLAMGQDEDFKIWEQYLVMSMAAVTDSYERLPLVQDKDILDNILYSGVWISYRNRQRKNGEEDRDAGSL